MANVQVFQRHAHLAGPVRLEFVNGRDGQVAKALLTAISNSRRGSGDSREEEATAIQWTLWGKQAENAAEYLGKGSHVNIIGRVRNNNYRDAAGNDVYTVAFTADEVDYLDSKADAEARRYRTASEGDVPHDETPAGQGTGQGAANSRSRSRADRQPAQARA
jgi:single stranded DNA-binding protein